MLSLEEPRQGAQKKSLPVFHRDESATTCLSLTSNHGKALAAGYTFVESMGKTRTIFCFAVLFASPLTQDTSCATWDDTCLNIHERSKISHGHQPGTLWQLQTQWRTKEEIEIDEITKTKWTRIWEWILAILMKEFIITCMKQVRKYGSSYFIWLMHMNCHWTNNKRRGGKQKIKSSPLNPNIMREVRKAIIFLSVNDMNEQVFEKDIKTETLGGSQTDSIY